MAVNAEAVFCVCLTVSRYAGGSLKLAHRIRMMFLLYAKRVICRWENINFASGKILIFPPANGAFADGKILV